MNFPIELLDENIKLGIVFPGIRNAGNFEHRLTDLEL
jgi:hypothetical protein